MPNAAPRFTICIPNYNYAHYLPQTLASVRGQSFADLEIVIADNASTDTSLEVIESQADDRIRVRVNRWNVGFAGNLDKAAVMAGGDHMIMLSSDDVARGDALEHYAKLLDQLPQERRAGAVICSSLRWIDSDGKPLGDQGPDGKMWRDATEDKDLSASVGAPVLHVKASELLRRSLLLMRNPLPFASTCYPRALYDAVEGYGGGRMINPDKWFVWKLLTVAEDVYFVDAPLFDYRWHAGNQAAQQQAMGALKHLADEYASTLELPPQMLEKAGLSKDDVIAGFVEEDIALRGLEKLSEGNRIFARRMLNFGKAAYPREVAKNWKTFALGRLISLGPIGTFLAKQAKARALKSYAAKHGGASTAGLRADAHR